MNTQQTAIILKGIASQLLSMNVPSIEELDKLLNQFDMSLKTNQKDLYIVITSHPVTKSRYIELPFVDSYHMTMYYTKFSTFEDALLFAKHEAEEWGKSTGYPAERVGDTYRKNGRTWKVISNPSWI